MSARRYATTNLIRANPRLAEVHGLERGMPGGRFARFHPINVRWVEDGSLYNRCQMERKQTGLAPTEEKRQLAPVPEKPFPRRNNAVRLQFITTDAPPKPTVTTDQARIRISETKGQVGPHTHAELLKERDWVENLIKTIQPCDD